MLRKVRSEFKENKANQAFVTHTHTYKSESSYALIFSIQYHFKFCNRRVYAKYPM